MKREDELDFLIEQCLYDAAWPSEMSEDDAARVEAGMAVARLNSIEPPPALAQRLEERIRRQAQKHPNGRVINIDRARRNGRIADLAPRPPARAGARFRFNRAWMGALGSVAVLLIAFIGVATAAAGSLPGDPLYGLRRFGQQLAVSNANSPSDRANVQITQLQGAIADLETEVGNGRSDADIMQALSVVASDTYDSQAAVAALPAGTARAEEEQSLANTLQIEQTTLYHLLGQVDWSLRLAFTQQLGALGLSIPTVTKVSITRGANYTLTLTLTGTNFASGVRLVINGKLRGTVTQSSATALTATISMTDLREDGNAIGVLNPDGTASQKIISTDDGEGGGDHGGQGTPGPGTTPGVTPTPGGTPAPTSTPDD
jgi:hypothetical protein